MKQTLAEILTWVPIGVKQVSLWRKARMAGKSSVISVASGSPAAGAHDQPALGAPAPRLRMRLFRLFCYMLPGLVLSCTCSGALDTNAVARLRNAPRIAGELYRCGDMVRAVNALRRVGKQQALEVLKNHLRENGIDGPPQEEEKLHLVCRLLFVDPQGWKYPHLGHALPEVDWKIAEELPLFPMALSRGVPFLLLKGYRAGGATADTARKCVERCENFSLISADLPEGAFQEAAQELIRSEAFQKLYLTAGGRKEAADMVLDQAQLTRPQPQGSGSISVTPAPGAHK
jgi:hypothetical protein